MHWYSRGIWKLLSMSRPNGVNWPLSNFRMSSPRTCVQRPVGWIRGVGMRRALGGGYARACRLNLYELYCRAVSPKTRYKNAAIAPHDSKRLNNDVNERRCRIISLARRK